MSNAVHGSGCGRAASGSRAHAAVGAGAPPRSMQVSPEAAMATQCAKVLKGRSSVPGAVSSPARCRRRARAVLDVLATTSLSIFRAAFRTFPKEQILPAALWDTTIILVAPAMWRTLE